MHTEKGRRLTISLSSCYIARPTHPTVLCLVAQSCPTLCNPLDCNPSGSSVHGDSPGKNTRVGCHALQGIFPTQGLNLGFPHCRQILSHLSHQGNPRILEWVAYLFSRGSSWPRNPTRVSCIAGGFFTFWATRKALFFFFQLKYSLVCSILLVSGMLISIVIHFESA